MLQKLSIKNYALIRELEMSPSKSFNIITGETGAGKSIMLGAIGLLLGNRADTKVLFDQDDKCVIEGEFHIKEYNLKNIFLSGDVDYEDSCIIRREINPAGKSRAFVNDTPVNLEFLKELGAELMDVHSQHETLLLGKSDFQIGVLDAYAGILDLLATYKTTYATYLKLQSEVAQLKAMAEASRKQEDYYRYLLKELTEANLINGEQEKNEEELKLQENSEDIKRKLVNAVQLISDTEPSIISHLQQLCKDFEQVAKVSKTYFPIKERLNSLLIELKDIASEIELEESKVEYDPARIAQIQERLDLIYSLQKKHQVRTLEELMALQTEFEQKVNESESFEEELALKTKSLEKNHQEILSLAQNLSEKRKKVKTALVKELESLLKGVGIENASIHIEMNTVLPGPYGVDKVSFLFSANKGVTPQELKNVASGGEFSRLMLCLKYILAGKRAMPTVVFDEIDTGISGEIAIKVGKMMKQMSSRHQIIAISHLPQIAAQGNKHYFVFKDNHSERAISKVKELKEQDRVLHIAQMIGGDKPSDIAISSAKELLSID